MRERKHERRWRSKGGKPFQVVHISDVHIDRSYLVSPLREASGSDVLITVVWSAWFQHSLLQEHLLS